MFYITIVCFFICFFASGTSLENPIQERKTVVLNMIVKNEADVIERCLQSVLPIIDTWVIVDTGSNDGTQTIIERFMREKNIPGKLYERPWMNFGYNRNEALSLAKDKADYILFMDADDYLSFSENFTLPELIEDYYLITSYDGLLESRLPRLIKSSRDWKWQGVIHEYITASHVKGSSLPGVKYVYNHDGARAKDPEALTKDLRLLQSDPSPRNLFYMICTYVQMKKYEEALESCKQRIAIGDRHEEAFMAYMIQSDLYHQLQKGDRMIKESLIQAFALRPNRLEPLYYLSCKLWKEKAYDLGYDLMRLARLLPQETDDRLCVQRWIYQYGILLQYARFSAMTGRYSEGIQAVEALLAIKNIPEADKKSAEYCKKYIQQEQMKECQAKLSNL